MFVFTAYPIYEALKFWLPLLSGFALVVKGYKSTKASISEWVSTLLNNHLKHIQDATSETVTETRRTNTILSEHNEKEMAVWQGVVNTLAILEDRTSTGQRVTYRSRRKKK